VTEASQPPDVRRALILERVQREGGASLADLARDHAVSPVTVHRDLEVLSESGLLQRVRGGARALPDPNQRIETEWGSRLREAGGAKDAIAAHARTLIEDGTTIFIDASSTGLALAHQLESEPPEALTLVTTSPAIALGVVAKSIHVIVTPGDLDQHMRVLTGRWTVEFLEQLNFATAFISPAGITLKHGLTTVGRPLADTLNAARASSSRTVGLMDASKFGRVSLLTVAPVNELDLVITDDSLPEATAQEFRAAGLRLDVARRVDEDGASE
jgi:DeoR family fructose operon transcriptional repressor